MLAASYIIVCIEVVFDNQSESILKKCKIPELLTGFIVNMSCTNDLMATFKLYCISY